VPAPDAVLSTPLQFLKGVGPRRAADFARAGLHTIEDLLCRFPLRYEDRSRLRPIASLKPGEHASIAARILSCGLRSTRRPGFKIFEALVADESGPLRVAWLNQPFLRDVFAPGQHVVFYGAVEIRAGAGLQLTNPQYEIIDDEDGETIHTGRIVPVYERAGTLTPKVQRKLVHEALERACRPTCPTRFRGMCAPVSGCRRAGPRSSTCTSRRRTPPLSC
jgi:ATP-dependent DNA helicase RecG